MRIFDGTRAVALEHNILIHSIKRASATAMAVRLLLDWLTYVAEDMDAIAIGFSYSDLDERLMLGASAGGRAMKLEDLPSYQQILHLVEDERAWFTASFPVEDEDSDEPEYRDELDDCFNDRGCWWIIPIGDLRARLVTLEEAAGEASPALPMADEAAQANR